MDEPYYKKVKKKDVVVETRTYDLSRPVIRGVRIMDEVEHHNFTDSIKCTTDGQYSILSPLDEVKGNKVVYLTKRDVEALAKHYKLIRTEEEVEAFRQEAFDEGYLHCEEEALDNA